MKNKICTPGKLVNEVRNTYPMTVGDKNHNKLPK